MELVPKRPAPHIMVMGPNSIIVVYMDPLGIIVQCTQNAILTIKAPMLTYNPFV